jgi:hypothetical protein
MSNFRYRLFEDKDEKKPEYKVPEQKYRTAIDNIESVKEQIKIVEGIKISRLTPDEYTAISTVLSWGDSKRWINPEIIGHLQEDLAYRDKDFQTIAN